MSEVIAGLVGGLLALSGAFLVQWRTEATAKRQTFRATVTEYLTSAMALSNEIGLGKLNLKGGGTVHARTQAMAARVELLTRSRLALTQQTSEALGGRVDTHADSLITLMHDMDALTYDQLDARRKTIRTAGQALELELRAAKPR